MYALSLWNPWADAIFRVGPDGSPIKPDETRHWPTNIRGRIAIHAAQRPLSSIIGNLPGLKNLMASAEIQPHELAFGVLIGTVEIVDCVRTEDAAPNRTSLQLRWGNYRPGRWAYVLAEPKRYPIPIPVRGRQRFFEVGGTSPELARLGARLEAQDGRIVGEIGGRK